MLRFGSKNVSVEERVLVAEERPDGVTRARKPAQGMENPKLDLRVVRHPLRKGSPRRAL
jgi:hypothetical protein